MKVVLASASPRRRELLKYIFDTFDVMPSHAEEHSVETDPKKYAMQLSKVKAQDIAEKVGDDVLIIGSDTVVAVLEGEQYQILGKPKDESDATRMLRLLSGRTHQVITGVTLIQRSEKTEKTFCEVTDVTFAEMSDEEIADYVATGDPMDKAGAYGIQSGAAKFAQGITGDYNNVVGLPVARIYQELKTEKSI